MARMGPGRFPLAVGHPDYPDELLVAVLTDDEAYMDEPSVRMRERYWVERLERRGWTVYRAFSAGVFVDPSAEAERICQLVLDIVDKRQSVSDDGEAVPELISDDGDSAAAGYGAGAGLGAGSGGLAGAGSGLGSRSGHTTGAGGIAGAGAGAAGERPVPPPPGLSSSAAGVSSAGQGASAASAHSAAAAGQGSEGAGQGAVGTNAAGAGDGAGAGDTARERDVRPPIAQGLPLQAYSDDQLDDLVSWIRSDGVERSEDEEVEQLRETLALKRRGTTVDAVLHHAVKRGRN